MNEQDKQRGLYNKYTIAHTDGSPVEPEAKYFVLRYDGDSEHAAACRSALWCYAAAIEGTNPELAKDVRAGVVTEGGKALVEQHKQG